MFCVCKSRMCSCKCCSPVPFSATRDVATGFAALFAERGVDAVGGAAATVAVEEVGDEAGGVGGIKVGDGVLVAGAGEPEAVCKRERNLANLASLGAAAVGLVPTLAPALLAVVGSGFWKHTTTMQAMHRG